MRVSNSKKGWVGGLVNERGSSWCFACARERSGVSGLLVRIFL